MSNKERQNICWNCKKNQGECPWSRSFKPVEGWTATEGETYTFTDRQGNPYKSVGYHITACPLYEQKHRFFDYSEVVEFLSKHFSVTMGAIYVRPMNFINKYERETNDILPLWVRYKALEVMKSQHEGKKQRRKENTPNNI